MFIYCLGVGEATVPLKASLSFFLPGEVTLMIPRDHDSDMISRNQEWLIWILLVTRTSVWFLLLISTSDSEYSRRFWALHFHACGRWSFSVHGEQNSGLDTGERCYWKKWYLNMTKVRSNPRKGVWPVGGASHMYHKAGARVSRVGYIWYACLFTLPPAMLRFEWWLVAHLIF